MKKTVDVLRQVGHILKEYWNIAGNPRFCCGVSLDSKPDYMPTASSCCGVRA
jgi:hypothetical protein